MAIQLSVAPTSLPYLLLPGRALSIREALERAPRPGFRLGDPVPFVFTRVYSR